MAASVLRRLGFKKHDHRESEARQKLQKELFSFSKCTEHGFPFHPSAVAYDPKLKLGAIGTDKGNLRVFGRPGVEFSAKHSNSAEVHNLFFLSEQARLLSVCSDNSLHLWEINIVEGNSILEEVRTFSFEASKVKSISSVCLSLDNSRLLVGTENGNIHIVTLPDLTLSDKVIYQDALIQNVTEESRVNTGPIEVLAQHPTEYNKYLVGFNKGLVVLWDVEEDSLVHAYNTSQHLESLAWHRDGTQFMSSHVDGSYIIWSMNEPARPKEQATTPYGPFPCKAITKLSWKTAKLDPFIIFSGGMPRASYGDRHTVSVIQGNNHVVFDLTSRVIDYIPICTADELGDYDRFDYDDPHSLLIVTEEECVMIDLLTEGWPCFRLPYLNCIHPSALTSSFHVGNVPEPFWDKILDAGESQEGGNFSSREWPITGGQTLPVISGCRDMLLTGHEDGAVRFWDVSTVSMRLLYTLKTQSIFGLEFPASDQDAGEDEWPPFRKVGNFDPYTDDYRLTINKIHLCPISEVLALGGTAGQVMVMQFEREARSQEIKVTKVKVIQDTDSFVWKGHEALPVQEGEVKFEAGFQPISMMQLDPPAICTALTMHPVWQLVAAGTTQGFVVFDYSQRVEIASKRTIPLPDGASGGDEHLSRRKTFKKSLRDSFRRLRKRRSQRQTDKAKSPKKSPEKKPDEKKDEGGEKKEEKTEEGAQTAQVPEAAAASAPEATPAHAASELEGKPVERAVEARTEKDEQKEHMVRAMTFAQTFLLNSQHHCPTFWAGTDNGTVYIYQLTIPESDKREAEQVKCTLAKEIQLKHHAPVIQIAILDKSFRPLPAPLDVENERAKAPDMSGGHHVLIISEEQFKIFNLPSLKAQHKFKLTALEGSKARRTALVDFRSKSDERYTENDLVLMSNYGEVQIFSIPQLKRQLKEPCISNDNLIGINSATFAYTGECFSLTANSEFTRFSLSARYGCKPACEVILKDSVRPPLPEPEKPKEEEAVPAVEEAQKEAEAPPAESVPAVEVGAGDAPQTETTENAGAAAATAQPAESGAEGPKAEETKAEDADVSVLTTDAPVLNDSTAAGDTTADMTVDSVRVHLNESHTEESNSVTRTVQQSMSSVTRTTVTRTVVQSSATDGGTVTESQTTTTITSGSPFDDDTVQSDSTVAKVIEVSLENQPELSVGESDESPRKYKQDNTTNNILEIDVKDDVDSINVNNVVTNEIKAIPPVLNLEAKSKPVYEKEVEEDVIIAVKSPEKESVWLDSPLFIGGEKLEFQNKMGVQEEVTPTEDKSFHEEDWEPLYGKVEDPHPEDFGEENAPRLVFTDPVIDSVVLPHTKSYHEFLMPEADDGEVRRSSICVPQEYREPTSRRVSLNPETTGVSLKEQIEIFEEMPNCLMYRVLYESAPPSENSPRTMRRHRQSVQANLLYNLQKEADRGELPSSIDDMYIAAETTVSSPLQKGPKFNFSGILSDDPNVGDTYTEDMDQQEGDENEDQSAEFQIGDLKESKSETTQVVSELTQQGDEDSPEFQIRDSKESKPETAEVLTEFTPKSLSEDKAEGMIMRVAGIDVPSSSPAVPTDDDVVTESEPLPDAAPSAQVETEVRKHDSGVEMVPPSSTLPDGQTFTEFSPTSMLESDIEFKTLTVAGIPPPSQAQNTDDTSHVIETKDASDRLKPNALVTNIVTTVAGIGPPSPKIQVESSRICASSSTSSGHSTTKSYQVSTVAGIQPPTAGSSEQKSRNSSEQKSRNSSESSSNGVAQTTSSGIFHAPDDEQLQGLSSLDEKSVNYSIVTVAGIDPPQ